ncbi:unnamed protein product [Adineta ricciae]|uniref:Uncharacterized protein n=1 Tax=Adineta ricciae TaxID=249248 RepID=A0A815BPY1_ADIRI|nr:unnamed protein product [Adineta ricciae]
MHGKRLIGSALFAMIVLAMICDARSIKNKASYSKRLDMEDSEDFNTVKRDSVDDFLTGVDKLLGEIDNDLSSVSGALKSLVGKRRLGNAFDRRYHDLEARDMEKRHIN